MFRNAKAGHRSRPSGPIRVRRPDLLPASRPVSTVDSVHVAVQQVRVTLPVVPGQPLHAAEDRRQLPRHRVGPGYRPVLRRHRLPACDRAPFCDDGVLTGENCTGVVDASSVRANINDNGTIETVCNVTSGHSSDGRRLVQHGDSSGPAYVKDTGAVGNSGIIGAGNVDSGQPGTTCCSPTSKLCLTKC